MDELTEKQSSLVNADKPGRIIPGRTRALCTNKAATEADDPIAKVESSEAKNVVEGRMPRDCGTERATDEHRNWRKIEALISEISCHHCSTKV